jgi:hypothetical protein
MFRSIRGQLIIINEYIISLWLLRVSKRLISSGTRCPVTKRAQWQNKKEADEHYDREKCEAEQACAHADAQ